ncbi:MAG: hypothetical protein ACLQIB_02755 [Isosphaeraceae bacterium]
MSRARQPSDRESGPRRTNPRDEARSVYVPSGEPPVRRSHRWWWILLSLFGLAALGSVAVMVAWPRINPRRLDPIEQVAESYLKALAQSDAEAARRLSTIDEPPGIRSVRTVARDRRGSHTIKGSFAPLGQLHARIEAEYLYDTSAGRFTPKNALGAAAETLDALHAAKEDAEKSGMYKKMQSGDPDDIFDSAEQLGKVFTKLAEGALAPKRILPTYQMLVESSKPPVPDDAKALALEVAKSPKDWDALLKRPFHSLKPDGPFLYERAEVTATVMDKLASLGDPPSKLRLTLVRFRLEGIDTTWKVVSARRILPGSEQKPAEKAPASPPRSLGTPAPKADPGTHSLHDSPGSP